MVQHQLVSQQCSEYVLNDIVRVDLVPASDCHFGIPPQIPMTELEVQNLQNWTPESASHAVIGKAALSVAFNVQDGDDGTMESAPQLTRTPKTTDAGLINTLTLDVQLTGGFESTREAAQQLHRRDFHAILTTDEGVLYLLYSLPNSCECLLKGQGIGQQDTLTVAMQSASQVIRLI